MATINDIVEQVRFHIWDYATVQVNAVNETPSAAKLNPLDSTNYWNEVGTGKDYEEFLTENMPLVSGGTVRFRGGRWNYESKGEFPDNYAENSKREFFVDYYRGLFVIPSGAPPVTSGAKVYLSYPWTEEQEYRFSDTEIKKWVVEGDSFLRNKVSLSYTINGRGDNLSFTPVPSGIEFSLLSLSTSYLIRKRLQEEGIECGIFIRDGDQTVDTTKTLAHRGKSLAEVKNDLDQSIKDVQRSNIAAAGQRLDIYSTRHADWETGIGSDQEIVYPGDFIPWSGDDY